MTWDSQPNGMDDPLPEDVTISLLTYQFTSQTVKGSCPLTGVALCVVPSMGLNTET